MFKVYLLNGQVISEDKKEWKKLPNIPILKMEYSLPNNKTLVLEGFQGYLIIKEIYKFVYGAKGEVVDTINVLGLCNDSVYQFSWHLKKGKFFQSRNEINVFKPVKVIPFQKGEYVIELGNPIKINSKKWKVGVVGLIPTARIV